MKLFRVYTIKKVIGTVSNCNQTTADTYNKYFATVAQDILAANTTNGKAAFIKNNPLRYLFSAFNQSSPSTKLKFVSSKEIEDITNCPMSKDSHGYEEISIKILKETIPYVSSPLTYLCNRMLSSGIFLLDLDYEKLNHYLKKAVKSNISHYTPTSILTFFSKIFEKIIITRLIQHLNYNQTLVEFGLRNKSSTDSATYKLLNDILTSLNSKLIVGRHFLRSSKSFQLCQ